MPVHRTRLRPLHVVAVAVALVACGGDTNAPAPSPPTALVPAVKGVTTKTAVAAVRGAGLSPDIQFIERNDVKPGIVWNQLPGPEARLPLGSTVTLYISTKPPPPPKQIKVPDVVGEKVRKAGNDLLDAGLDSRIEKKASSKSVGSVISQDPRPGTKVDEGTVVTLVVSKVDPLACDRNKLDCLEKLGEYLAEQEGFAGRWEAAYILSYKVCSAFPPEEFVRQGYETFGSTEPEDVARAYAKETYNPAAEPAGEAGCLAAFEGRP